MYYNKSRHRVLWNCCQCVCRRTLYHHKVCLLLVGVGIVILTITAAHLWSHRLLSNGEDETYDSPPADSSGRLRQAGGGGGGNEEGDSPDKPAPDNPSDVNANSAHRQPQENLIIKIPSKVLSSKSNRNPGAAVHLPSEGNWNVGSQWFNHTPNNNNNNSSLNFSSPTPQQTFRQQLLIQPDDAEMVNKYSSRCQHPKRTQPIGYPGQLQHTVYPLHLCEFKIPFLVVVVVSKPENEFQRTKIRRSWASIQWVDGHYVQHLFVVGSSTTPEMQAGIERELEENQDLLQVAYPHTLKTRIHFQLAAYHFILRFCASTSYILVLPDETFVNIPHLVLQLAAVNVLNPELTEIFCSIRYKAKAVRVTGNEYFVSRLDWPRVYYPSHCDFNAGYITSLKVVRDLLYCAYHYHLFWYDEVFLSGILARRMNIGLQEFWPGFSHTPMMPHHVGASHLVDYVFLTDGGLFEDMIWRRLLQKSLINVAL